MEQTLAHVIIALYKEEDQAELSFNQFKDSDKIKEENVEAAVVIRKDANSEMHYHDVGITPAKGALGGVVIGGLLGILTGGATLVLGAIGALVGGFIGEKKRAEQLPSTEINQVITSLAPGSSALVAVVLPEYRESLSELLSSSGAEVITADIPSELADKLENHRAEAYAHWREQIGE